MNAKVAIILVNYNGYEDTVDCVRSLKEIKYPHYDIYIVDNGSMGKQKLQDDLYINKQTKLILSEENLGFAGANNLVIKAIQDEQYDYVLLLNNDTVVETDFLDEMVTAAEADPSVGIVGGKIYYYHDRSRVWAAGGEYDRRIGKTVQYGGLERSDLDIEKYVTFTTGCLMLIPIPVIKKVGLLEEHWFLYSEDTDYCQRVIDLGYKIKYVPTARIYHKVSAAIGDSSYLQQRYMIRNDLYMVERYCKIKWKAYLYIMYRSLKDIVRGRKNLLPIIRGVSDYRNRRIGKI